MKATILIIASSLSKRSRSTTMALHARAVLAQNPDIELDYIDLAENDIGIYPRSTEDPEIRRMAEQFERADGFVLATPVYNWHEASSLPNFLHYVMSEGGRRYRPFVILGGAGTVRSHLSLDGLSRTVLTELHGVQIGPPIIGTSPDLSPEEGVFSDGLKSRILTPVNIVAHVALAAKLAQPEPALAH